MLDIKFRHAEYRHMRVSGVKREMTQRELLLDNKLSLTILNSFTVDVDTPQTTRVSRATSKNATEFHNSPFEMLDQ